MIKIQLMRHGEPEGGKRFRGNTLDDPLTDKGWQQMRDAVQDHEPWDCVVTSPLLRCQEFAHEVSEHLNIPCDIIDGLKEVGFGHWEGKSRAIVRAMHAKEYALFYASPENNPPKDAEQLGVFYRRILEVIKHLKQNYDGQNILLVSHAGVIRAILAYILEMPLNAMYKINVENAAIITIELSETNKVTYY